MRPGQAPMHTPGSPYEHVYRREYGLESSRECARSCHFPAVFATKLQVDGVLKGHRGCVNRLAWNQEGTMLASGSDDRQVLLWRYPETQRLPLAIQTQHQANIFGVAFLPFSGDRMLVTGAMDHTVQLHRLEQCPASIQPLPRPSTGNCSDSIPPPSAAMRRHPELHTQPVVAHTTVYSCHRGRVKNVDVDPSSPHLFFSAGEDGFVRQFDCRESAAGQHQFGSANALLALRAKGGAGGRRGGAGEGPMEIKALAINRVATHLMAIAAGDQWLRVYDRRMMSTGPPDFVGLKCEPLIKVAPPHLQPAVLLGRRPTRSYATHVAFSNRGDKVVATYHCDHAYSFDITGSSDDSAAGSTVMRVPPPRYRTAADWCHRSAVATTNAAVDIAAGAIGSTDTATQHQQQQQQQGQAVPCGGGVSGPSVAGASLPEIAEQQRACGNQAYFERRYPAAVSHYTRALAYAPGSAMLYINRATALLSRDWLGDAAFALRDCNSALAIDPASEKAHYRRVKALAALRLWGAAEGALECLRAACPGPVAAADAAKLEQELSEGREKQREQLREQRRRRRRRRIGGTGALRGVPTGGSGEDDDAGSASSGGEGEEGEEGGSDEAGARAAAASRRDGSTVMQASGYRAPAGVTTPHQRRPHTGANTRSVRSSGDAAADEPCTPAQQHGLVVVPRSRSADAAAAALVPSSSSPTDPAASDSHADASGAGSSSSSAAGAAATGAALGGAHPLPPWEAAGGGPRVLQRYVGQSNMQTDIKEACFLGSRDDLVAAGSDGGRLFLFDAHTGEAVAVLQADDDVCNCVQAHPSAPVLATSGIESVVRLWAPTGVPRSAAGLLALVERGQREMRQEDEEGAGEDLLTNRISPGMLRMLTDNPDLLALLLRRLPARAHGGGSQGTDGGGGDDDDDEEDEGQEVDCRMA